MSEHKKILLKLDSADFKTKQERKVIEDKVNEQITKLEIIKKKLEVVQKNRWWPVPQFSIHKESYFIPSLTSKGNNNGSDGTQINVAVQIRKEPAGLKTAYTIIMNSISGFKEERKIENESKSVIEEFMIPLEKLDDIKNYTVSLTGTIRKRGFLC